MNDRNLANNDYDEIDIPSFVKKTNYDDLVKKSTNGKATRAVPKKVMKVNKKHVKTALATLCCTCVLIGSVAANGINALRKGLNDSFEIGDAILDYKAEAINENTYRVNNGQNYAYHYDQIAEHVKTDEDVYLLYRSIGEYQANLVLEYVDNIDNIDSFIEKHHYKDKDEWIKESNQKILLQNDILNKQRELDRMQADYEASNKDIDNNELGGK